MISSLTTKAVKLTGEIDVSLSSASPLFWVVAAYITEGDVVLKNARSETNPLDFLPKLQKVGIPFEVQENDLHVWFEALEQGKNKEFDNSLEVSLLPLYLKLPFNVTVNNISEHAIPKATDFIKEAKRVGANVKLTGTSVFCSTSKIRSGRYAWQENNEQNQALLLLSLLARGKSTFLCVSHEFDYLKPFITN